MLLSRAPPQGLGCSRLGSTRGSMLATHHAIVQAGSSRVNDRVVKEPAVPCGRPPQGGDNSGRTRPEHLGSAPTSASTILLPLASSALQRSGLLALCWVAAAGGARWGRARFLRADGWLEGAKSSIPKRGMLALMPVALVALTGAASNPTVTFHGHFDDYTVVPGGTKTPVDLEFAGTWSADPGSDGWSTCVAERPEPCGLTATVTATPGNGGRHRDTS